MFKNNHFLFFFLFLFVAGSYAQENTRNSFPSASDKTSFFEYNSSLRSDNYINESFEDVTFPPAGWAKINVIAGSTGWARSVTGVTPIPGWNGGTVSAPPGGGNAVAWMNYTFGGTSSNDNWLVTPLIENIETGDSLTFWMRMFSNLYADNVDIKISTTVNNDPAAFTITVANLAFTASAADTGWKYYSYDISGLVTAGSDIYIGFREHVANNQVDGNAIFLDLVKAGSEGGPGVATNPNPTNGATGVAISGLNLSWTNPAGATSNEVLFGTDPGSLSSIHSGSLVSTVAAPSPLIYSTTYYWRVDETDGTGTTQGPMWTFTTESDPGIVTLFFDDFESNNDTTADGWIITNDGGTLVWRVFAPTYPNSYTLPCGTCGKVLAADSDEGGSSTGPTTLLSTATIDQTFDGTMYQSISVEFDNDVNVIDADDYSYVEVSNDGGNTWNIAWQWGGSTTDLRNTHEVVDLSQWAGLNNFKVRFRSVQPGWDWWWTVDNVEIKAWNEIPVELSSFTASIIGGQVNLNWQTASETNNYGFEVERKAAGQEFSKVGFVAGYGTTTETKSYTYMDNTASSGSYTYRLKQVDFDGTFEYSPEVEVDLAPSTYSLAQNYPNPFNPVTKIDFSLASDSKVTLKIFDILGQEVTKLIDGNLSSGKHNITFDASTFNSGVYFYSIDAKGVDGSNFKSTKKMILTK